MVFIMVYIRSRCKIWNLIQKPIVLDKLVEKIYEEYDVDKEQCKNDIFELVGEFLDNGLVNINE